MAHKQTLNPYAQEFYPPPSRRERQEYYSYYSEFDAEDNLTPEELEELEMTEEWVRTMAALEEAEREHLITIALQHADPSKLSEIEKKYGSKPVGRKHGRRSHPRPTA